MRGQEGGGGGDGREGSELSVIGGKGEAAMIDLG